MLNTLFSNYIANPENSDAYFQFSICVSSRCNFKIDAMLRNGKEESHGRKRRWEKNSKSASEASTSSLLLHHSIADSNPAKIDSTVSFNVTLLANSIDNSDSKNLRWRDSHGTWSGIQIYFSPASVKTQTEGNLTGFYFKAPQLILLGIILSQRYEKLFFKGCKLTVLLFLAFLPSDLTFCSLTRLCVGGNKKTSSSLICNDVAYLS